MGDDIFIVDAETGNLLWNMRDDAEHGSNVSHAIPGGVRILDVNRNGFLDRMYFADTGGNVWRLDLDETLGSESILTKLASLGGGGANARKFYNEPDVAKLRYGGKTKYTISLGSGLRPHPLNTVIKDKMFILVDESPFTAVSEDYSVITLGNLSSITQSGGKVTSEKGWYFGFSDAGEKVLSSSIT